MSRHDNKLQTTIYRKPTRTDRLLDQSLYNPIYLFIYLFIYLATPFVIFIYLFSNTFRYIDDLLSVNNENFGNYISDIYPSDLELKDTTLTSNEVCYLDTRIRNGDSNTPFHLSVYDKRDDFSFRIVNFPHMDSNIPANPAYGVYISQLVRYVRICTSKLDFIRRLRRLSSRLLHQGFKSTLLHKSFTKFFKRHSAIIEKYGTTLREIRLAIQN